MDVTRIRQRPIVALRRRCRSCHRVLRSGRGTAVASGHGALTRWHLALRGAQMPSASRVGRRRSLSFRLCDVRWLIAPALRNRATAERGIRGRAIGSIDWEIGHRRPARREMRANQQKQRTTISLTVGGTAVFAASTDDRCGEPMRTLTGRTTAHRPRRIVVRLMARLVGGAPDLDC